MKNRREKQYKLSVLKMIPSVLLTVWRLRIEFFKKLSLPIFFWIVIDYTQQIIDGYPIVISGIVFWFLSVYLIVTCHRIVILGGQSVPSFRKRGWTRRETRFLSWSVWLFFSVGLVVLVGAILSIIAAEFISFLPNMDNILMLILAIPIIYMVARVNVIFPAVAIDKKPDIEWACSISEGNGWRLVILIGFYPLIAVFVDMLFGQKKNIFIENIVLSILTVIFLVLETTALSLSYKELIQNNQIDDGEVNTD